MAVRYVETEDATFVEEQTQIAECAIDLTDHEVYLKKNVQIDLHGGAVK